MILDLQYLAHQQQVFFETEGKYIIVPKGRRVGLTKGAANAFIEYMMEGISPLLWVDTVNGNIERYYDRYFLPELKQLPDSWYSFNRQKKELNILGAICDFRSAEHPETIEGFGYKKIFLNEAGIILKDNYLYTNSILPMMLDYPESVLIAAGVPKGKIKKDGTKHKFYELYENAISGKKGYALRHYTSFDNPILSEGEIKDLIDNMSASEARQEIYGEFLNMAGTNPFAYAFSEKNKSELAVFKPGLPMRISVDFNLNPFGVTFGHIWRDQNGEHAHTFNEGSIPNGSIPAMADFIKKDYEGYLYNAELTGDAMGNRGDISQRDNASLYTQLLGELRMRDGQLKTVGNPTHENSRADCNYVFKNMDYKVNPKTCPSTVLDLESVQCDAFGQIIKKNRNDVTQRADHLDCERYRINTFMKEWVESHKKRRR